MRSGYPIQLLYDDPLALVNESLDSLEKKLGEWKGELESKGLRDC